MKTILIIEDCQAFLENLSEYLELEGYTIIKANNGRKGIDLALEYLPDLIVCDFFMPEMNGTEVKNHLLSSNITSKIPFILSTSITMQISKSKNTGYDMFNSISKPFELELLLKMIQHKLFKAKRNNNYMLKNLHFRTHFREPFIYSYN